MEGFSQMTEPNSVPPSAKNQSFADWTEDEILELAERHRNESTVEIDYDRPVVRVDHDVIHVPAWITICPGD
jgi:hypothetical protein